MKKTLRSRWRRVRAGQDSVKERSMVGHPYLLQVTEINTLTF